MKKKILDFFPEKIENILTKLKFTRNEIAHPAISSLGDINVLIDEVLIGEEKSDCEIILNYYSKIK